MSEETGRNVFQNTEAQVEFEDGLKITVELEDGTFEKPTEKEIEAVRRVYPPPSEVDDPIPELNLGTLWEKANPTLSDTQKEINRLRFKRGDTSGE